MQVEGREVRLGHRSALVQFAPRDHSRATCRLEPAGAQWPVPGQACSCKLAPEGAASPTERQCHPVPASAPVAEAGAGTLGPPPSAPGPSRVKPCQKARVQGWGRVATRVQIAGSPSQPESRPARRSLQGLPSACGHRGHGSDAHAPRVPLRAQACPRLLFPRPISYDHGHLPVRSAKLAPGPEVRAGVACGLTARAPGVPWVPGQNGTPSPFPGLQPQWELAPGPPVSSGGVEGFS